MTATCILTFVNDNRLQKTCGSNAVGANKVLFQIETVKIPTPNPFSMRNNSYSRDFTLKDSHPHLNLLIIMSPNSSLENLLPM